MVLSYLDSERYGIWLVLFSLSTWFRFMDVGLAHGLRNKFAESIAKNEKLKAKHYISTTYTLITIISSIFFVLFLCLNHFLNWSKILNTSAKLQDDLSLLAVFVFGSFSLSFVLKIITTLLVAYQKTSIVYLKNLFEKILKVIIVLALIYTTDGSLLKLGISYSLIPVIILIGISIFYFSTTLKDLRPKRQYIDFSYLKDISQLGWKFFIIQISVVILFASDNIIISQLFGPEHVTPYEISKKYFSVPLILFMVIVNPLWSAVTEAYNKNDYAWIRKSINTLINIWVMFSFLTVIMLLISKYAYSFWIGDKVIIPFELSACWALFSILQSYNLIFTYFINGIGYLKIQLIGAVISICINIPLSIFLAKYLHFGLSGVILATNFSILFYGISRTIQYYKIINKSAHGIWTR